MLLLFEEGPCKSIVKAANRHVLAHLELMLAASLSDKDRVELTMLLTLKKRLYFFVHYCINEM